MKYWSNIMSLKPVNKESQAIRETVDELLKISRENNSVFWRDVARRIAASRRTYASVNVGKIDSLVNDGETVVVPGSLLGSGYFEKKVTLAAIRVSKGAFAKISNSGGEIKSLVDLARENPKGTNIRLLR